MFFMDLQCGYDPPAAPGALASCIILSVFYTRVLKLAAKNWYGYILTVLSCFANTLCGLVLTFTVSYEDL